MLLASCTGWAVVLKTRLGVNGQAFDMLPNTLNCIRCSVVEPLMPELESEWGNSSCICSLGCMECRQGAAQELVNGGDYDQYQ